MDMVFFPFFFSFKLSCLAISEFACRGEINSEVSITVNNFDAVIINVKAAFVKC